MQQFLPLGLRGLLVTRPWMTVTKIYRIFTSICNNVWNPSEIESFKTYVAVNLALVGMHFPPFFF
jgi:hypothetical protein